MERPVIFDFDGTLADTFQLLLDESAAFTKRDKFSSAEVEHLRTLIAHDVLREMNVTPDQVPMYLRQVQAGMLKRVNEIALFDGIKDVLECLAKERQLFVVSTNNIELISAVLRTHGIGGYFSDIISTGLHKAEALNELCIDRSYRPRDCLYVGDEIRDIIACRRVGVRCIAVTWGYNTSQSLQAAGPDFLVSTPRELIAIIESKLNLKQY